jgi:modulator of FtsH protease
MNTLDASRGNGIVIEGNAASLLARVLWITTAGFLFTALGAYLSPDIAGFSSLFLFFLTLGLVFAINAASRKSPGLALVLFYTLTVLMGVEVGPMIKAYLHMANGQNIVFEAAATTAMGMCVMALVAHVVTFDYRRYYNYAIAALFVLIIVGLISSFVYFVSPGIYAWLTLVLFSVLLLFDFMRLKDGGRSRNGMYVATPVQLALSIYLDALNIFLALLQIFGGGRRRS